MRFHAASFAALAAVVLFAGSSAAEGEGEGEAEVDQGACADAANRAEVLKRDPTKLLKLRDALQGCAAEGCSTLVRDDCRAALSEVQTNLPSVVLVAEEESGAPLFDAKVSVDGEALTAKLDGKPIAIDPGLHTFVFELAGRTSVDVRIVLRAGQKNVDVLARFAKPPAVEPAPAPAPPAVVAPAPAQPAQPGEPGKPGPWRTVGFVTAGVGVVGLTVGAIFGLKASGTLSEPACDPSAKVCDAGVIDDAKSAAGVSTVGFIAGGLLLAGGVALVLIAPGAKRPAAAATETKRQRLIAAPTVGVNGGGLSLRGIW